MQALSDAGIVPREAYVTNAVKHFKFELRGKRRIHQRPQRSEIVACRPWLVSELSLVAPRVLVALGATAGSSLLGPSFRVTRDRGVLMPWPASLPGGSAAARILATIHPSAVLRADDRDAVYDGLVADLKVVAGAL